MNTALVIDDDELDMELLRLVLSNEGYQVLTTADGPQGITMFKRHMPSFVFLDLGLPTMSGIEVLREIKSYDNNAKVVLITGYGSIESAVEAMRYGALDFLEKTWDAADMMHKIQGILYAYG
jgi:DNA-binding NtrC family response regulator